MDSGKGERRALLSLRPDELEALVVEAGGKRFHAASMRRWVLERGAAEMSQITDLPKLVLGRLSQKITLLESEVAARREAADGTTKILLKLRDGETIEVVRMKGTSTATACISTQVGCPMACAFCASGLNGLVRNLETHEILEQVVRARQIGPIGRIVVMGIGEPLLNLEALLGALDVVTAPDGIALSGRKITISTIGLPDRIRKLAQANKPYTLAISLHAPTDALRNELIPTAKKVTIDSLLASAREYFRATGREVTFEYVLLRDVNDRIEQARELARRLRGVRATVNLIPYNPVASLPFRRPTEDSVRAFREALRRAGLVATVRWSRGVEADAACGQLRISLDATKESVTNAPGFSNPADNRPS